MSGGVIRISNWVWLAMPASGWHTTPPNEPPALFSTWVTRATASPAGYTPSRPEVTTTSLTWMSALGAVKRSSSVPDLPRP